VQIWPMISMVACFFLTSTRRCWGQPASSHTVTRLFSPHDLLRLDDSTASPARGRGSSRLEKHACVWPVGLFGMTRERLEQSEQVVS